MYKGNENITICDHPLVKHKITMLRNKETGKIRAHSFHLYTYTNLEETEIIINMFKEKFDINFYKIKHTSKKTGITSYYLKCRTKEGRKLSNLIRPYSLNIYKYEVYEIENKHLYDNKIDDSSN